MKVRHVLFLGLVMAAIFTACSSPTSSDPGSSSDPGGSGNPGSPGDPGNSGDPALTGTVSITGTAKAGQSLEADITLLDGGGTPGYHWKRADTSDGVYAPITDATGSSYLLAAADADKYIVVEVSRDGYAGTITSDPAGPVVPALLAGGAGLYVGESTYPQDLGVPFNLAAALAWIDSNSVGQSYRILLGADESAAAPKNLSTATGITITLEGKDTVRVVQLDTAGSLFTVGDKVTLILGSNITLKGKADNNAALVSVNSGGKLEMRANAKITENTNNQSGVNAYGGGVLVNAGEFVMQDSAEVSGNTVVTDYLAYGGGIYVRAGIFTMNDYTKVSRNTGGGGVYLDTYGSNITFTMNDYAEVSYNQVGSRGGVTAYESGGGIVTFTMNDHAKVSYNQGRGVYASTNDSAFDVPFFTMNDNAEVSYNEGGGVYIVRRLFEMKGSAKVSYNTISTLQFPTGGGVCNIGGIFNMYGDTEVSNNTAFGTSGAYGGGVSSSKQFNMYDNAKVSGNTASASIEAYGGGVNNGDGTFTMNGNSKVSGNKASAATAQGSGVYVTYIAGTLIMNGGTIYGSASGEDSNTLEGTTRQGASLFKGGNGTAKYGDTGNTPLIAGDQVATLYTDATLTGHQ